MFPLDESSNTAYAGSQQEQNLGMYRVVFRVNKTGAKLVRGFDSPYLAKQFVRKLKYSKTCTVVSFPT